MNELDALKNRVIYLTEKKNSYYNQLEYKWNLGYRISEEELKNLNNIKTELFYANEEYHNCLNSRINTIILARKNLL